MTEFFRFFLARARGLKIEISLKNRSATKNPHFRGVAREEKTK